MPYISIKTNQSVETETQHRLLRQLSTNIANELGKPERYVMVAMDPPTPMIFAGTDEPLAFIQLKSIGLMDSQTENLSRIICNEISTSLTIASERIYIEFIESPRKMWGWNSSTF